ncbi:cyclin-like protein [Raphanus sativus]|uniref:F-box protein At1g52495-like n=1 Tax=Raphanus sativus TaxID=3726 RepID=A0A6J0KP32_RAPSA|nr:F-box protein At1g52495-like [Raphanus sativus]KAJ4882105.1 cyclin-like protein [Raphanus sativus]
MLSVCKRTRKTVTGDEEGRGYLCLPLDIIVEILKKLPAKSLVRFRSVSKQWLTIIGSRRDFIDSIITRSLSHPPPKLPIFIFHHCVPETFFTVSPVFSPTTHTDNVVTIPRPSHQYSFHYQYSRGLICCSSSESHLVTIYNPTTRQVFPLPEIQAPTRSGLSSCFFGYDPITNQYKVLSIIFNYDDQKQTYHVFTLGCQQSWRKVKGIDEDTFPNDYNVCIDGTIYYSAYRKSRETLLLSFDIRSERFDRIQVPKALSEAMLTLLYHQRLVNHLGKLGCICCNDGDTSIWIMDDAEKQEWSRTILCLPNYPLKLLGADVETFSGATPAGEIYATQCKYFFDKSLYVYYYDMNQNSFRRIHIEGGVRDKTNKHRCCVKVFAIHDHVENTMWL